MSSAYCTPYWNEPISIVTVAVWFNVSIIVLQAFPCPISTSLTSIFVLSRLMTAGGVGSSPGSPPSGKSDPEVQSSVSRIEIIVALALDNIESSRPGPCVVYISNLFIPKLPHIL